MKSLEERSAEISDIFKEFFGNLNKYEQEPKQRATIVQNGPLSPDAAERLQDLFEADPVFKDDLYTPAPVGTRSDKEFRLCARLWEAGFSETEIYSIMASSPQTKWLERDDSYRWDTIRNAVAKSEARWAEAESAYWGLGCDHLTKWSGKSEPIINEKTGRTELDVNGKPMSVPGRTLSPSKAAGALLQHLPLAVDAVSVRDKEPPIWIYEGIWHDQGQREIISLVDQLLDDLSYDRGLRETLRRIRGRLAQVPVTFDADPFLMPLQDGVVDLRTGEFREAKQEDYLTFKYNASWTGPADIRPLLWHLCVSLPDPRDVLTVIDLMTATALRVPFDVFWLFFGLGANGKGALEALLQAFFTLRRSTQIRLSELKNSRFGEGALLGKDVWIVSEVESVRDVLSSIKKITSGETIDVDVKYGERRQGSPHLLPIFDSNMAFDFGEETKGLKRRLEKLDFPYTFGNGPEDRPLDPLWKEKLIQPEVLNGIAHIIAARAPALIESRHIYHRKSEEEIQEEYKRQRFSLNYYCEDCLSTTWPYEKSSTEDLRLTTEKGYSEYLEYCKKFNVTPAAKVPFGKYINERFGIQSINTKEKKKDIRYYPGLYLVKSAALAFADVRTTYSYSSSDRSDRRETEERQKKYSGITISKWLATEATEEMCSETMRDVLREIKNMFNYIKSCESRGSLKDIVYENYLKNPVASVASVAGGQPIAKISTTEEATEEIGSVVEGKNEPPFSPEYLDDVLLCRRLKKALAEGVTDPIALSSICGLPVCLVAKFPGVNPIAVARILAQLESHRKEQHFSQKAEQLKTNIPKRFSLLYQPKGEALEYSTWGMNLVESPKLGSTAGKTCSNGCIYCYNRRGKTGYDSLPGPILKPNLLDRLNRDLPQVKAHLKPGERVHLTFVGDLYDREVPREISRKVLELFKDHGVPFQVLTKNPDRGLEDLDLYFDSCRFGTTLTFDNEEDSRHWEPNASLPAARIDSLKIAKSRGISTWVSIEPVIDPAQSLRLIAAVVGFVDFFGIGKLNHDAPRENGLNHQEFREEAETILRQKHKEYQIKKALKDVTEEPLIAAGEPEVPA